MVELVVRLVFSLTVVVGLLLLLARMSAKRFRGSSSALVQVVHRQALSRSSALAVVTVGSRVLVLGTTEQQVQLLTELDPEELVLSPGEAFDVTAETVDPEPDDSRLVAAGTGTSAGKRMRALGAARASDGALAGSLLSAQTWRQAFTAAIGGHDRDAS